MPIWNAIHLQNRNSPLIEHLSFFHDHTITILIITTSLTIILLVRSPSTKNFNRFVIEAQEIELFWTTLPALILVFIAIPSLKTLYLLEERINPLITIKTIGFQWHWGYEYSNSIKKEFNSINQINLNTRLIETSNHLVIPTNTPSRMLITSKDVIHSWAIPSLGIKVDAIPGRINQAFILTKRPSIIVGQCSEICGAGHRFIPIFLESPTTNSFLKNLF